MLVEFIINAKGQVQTQVLDRQGETCSNVERLTIGMNNLSSEKTGPDCDEVFETQNT